VGETGLVVPRVDGDPTDVRVGDGALQGGVSPGGAEGLDQRDVDGQACAVLDRAELEAAQRPQHAVQAPADELVAAEHGDADVHAGHSVVLWVIRERWTSCPSLDDPPTVTRDSNPQG